MRGSFALEIYFSLFLLENADSSKLTFFFWNMPFSVTLLSGKISQLQNSIPDRNQRQLLSRTANGPVIRVLTKDVEERQNRLDLSDPFVSVITIGVGLLLSRFSQKCCKGAFSLYRTGGGENFEIYISLDLKKNSCPFLLWIVSCNTTHQ